MFSAQQVTFAFTIASGGLASLLNVVLLVIIVRVRSKNIGRYSYLLFLYTLSALLYCISQILGAPTFFSNSSGYLLIDTARVLPPSLATTNLYFFMTCYLQTVVILVLSFVYRYCVVCNQDKLEVLHRNGWKIALVSIATLGSIAAIASFYMKPSEECTREFGADFLQSFGRSLSESGYVCAAITIEGQFNWSLFVALGSFCLVIAFGAATISFCAMKILRVIRENSRRALSMAQGQKRIFTLLLLQLAIPFLFNNLPVQFVLLCSYLNIDVSGVAHYVGALLSIAQVIDPVLTTIFIRPYKAMLFGKSRVYSTFRGSHMSATILEGK